MKKIHCSNLFCVFVKISFLSKVSIYVTYNPLLISSNRDEFFTTNTLKYPLEIKPAVLISDSPIRIYRILTVKNLFLAKTMLYLKKKRKWDCWKSSKLPLRYSRRYLKKHFQPNRTRFKGIFLWQDENYGKPRFSFKNPWRRSSRAENREKRGEVCP